MHFHQCSEKANIFHLRGTKSCPRYTRLRNVYQSIAQKVVGKTLITLLMCSYALAGIPARMLSVSHVRSRASRLRADHTNDRWPLPSCELLDEAEDCAHGIRFRL